MTLTSSKSTHSMTFKKIVQANDFIRFFRVSVVLKMGTQEF